MIHSQLKFHTAHSSTLILNPTVDAAEADETEEYDEHKEKLWELIVKHRRDKAFIRKVTKTSKIVKGTAKGKQTTISTFFKLASLNKRNDRDKCVEHFNFLFVFF